MNLLEERLGGGTPAPKQKPNKKEKTLYETVPSYGAVSDDAVNNAVDNRMKQQADIPVQGYTDGYEDDDILSVLKNNSNKVKKLKNQTGNNPYAQREIINESKEETEEDIEITALNKARQEEEFLRKSRIKTKIFNAVMITACVYVIFLIYGVFCTNYQYNDQGNVAPVVLSVKEIKALKNYDTILVQYENCRVLYEKVLQLDYRLGLGVEDPLTLAPEYEKLLEEVNDLTVKTDALVVDSRYDTIKLMLVNWVKTDTAIYLQKISSGISSNNADDAATALQYKTIMYDDFALISQNMVTIGENIEGANTNGIKKWSPEGYINEFINGEGAAAKESDTED